MHPMLKIYKIKLINYFYKYLNNFKKSKIKIFLIIIIFIFKFNFNFKLLLLLFYILAWPTYAAIFPTPIFRSYLTKKTYFPILFVNNKLLVFYIYI